MSDGIPPVLDSDSEDVAWALQTADALWKRNERVDAIVWVRRAAQAAGEADDNDRALGLARNAAELTESLVNVSANGPMSEDHVRSQNAVDALLAADSPDADAEVSVGEIIYPPSIAPSPSSTWTPDFEGDDLPTADPQDSPLARHVFDDTSTLDSPQPQSPLRNKAKERVPSAPEAHAGSLEPWDENDASRTLVKAPQAAPPRPTTVTFNEDEVITSAITAPTPEFLRDLAKATPSDLAPTPPPPPPSLKYSREASTQFPQLITAPAIPRLDLGDGDDDASEDRTEPRVPPPIPKGPPPLPGRHLPPRPPLPVKAKPTEPRAPTPSMAPTPVPTAPPVMVAESLPPEALDAPTLPPIAAPASAPSNAATKPPSAPRFDLSDVEAFADLPDDARTEFAAVADVIELAREEEVSGFALAFVIEGEVDVAATIVDAPAARYKRGAVLRSRGTMETEIPIRLIAGSATAKIATWKADEIAAVFKSCPWIEDDLRAEADKMQVTVGATMGPLGERLDLELRTTVLGRLTTRVLTEGEVVVEKGKPVPGIIVVGVGSLDLVSEGDATGVLAPGEFLFPQEVLGSGPSPATARAGKGGAIILVGGRMLAQELLVTCPPLLEIFAGM